MRRDLRPSQWLMGSPSSSERQGNLPCQKAGHNPNNWRGRVNRHFGDIIGLSSGCPTQSRSSTDGLGAQVPVGRLLMLLLSMYFDDATIWGQGSEASHSHACVSDTTRVLDPHGSLQSLEDYGPSKISKGRLHLTPHPPFSSVDLLPDLFKLIPQSEHLLWMGRLQKVIKASDVAHESGKGSAGSFLQLTQASLR